jgi:hypothetical protein
MQISLEADMSHPNVYKVLQPEVVLTEGGVSLKQHGGGAVMLFNRDTWESFVIRVKAGEFDFPKK